MTGGGSVSAAARFAGGARRTARGWAASSAAAPNSNSVNRVASRARAARELDAGLRARSCTAAGEGDVSSEASRGVEEAPGLTAVLEVLRDVSQIPPGGP